MKKIKFAEVDVNTDGIRLNVNNCIDTNWVTMGDKVKALEEKFKKIFGYKYVAAVNSGTTADLVAALSLYDVAGAIPRDSEIIVPALGFISAINACWMANLNLRFCDIRRETLNIDEDKIEELITLKTKAILAINTMGLPCKMDKLQKICDDYDLILISDNCEGHLCQYKGRMMSEWSDISTYSGYSAHLIFSTEMGWVGTNHQDIYDSVIANRNHGGPHGKLLFEHESIGWNGKPTDLHASIGLDQIDNIHYVFRKRTDHLKYLLSELEDLSDIFYFSPQETEEYLPCPHALSLTFKEDDEKRFNRFFGYLEGKGIEAKLNFKCIPTQQQAYTKHLNCGWMGNYGYFPEAEHVGRNGLHLPVHQFLSQEDLDYMVETIYSFADRVNYRGVY